MLGIIGSVIVGVGYYFYGDRFYDIITAAEARLKASELEASADGEAAPVSTAAAPETAAEGSDAEAVAEPVTSPPPAAVGETTPAQPAPPQSQQIATARPDPRPVRFADEQGRFAAVFPGPVSRFDNYLAGLTPELISSSQTFAATGLDIVAQVSILNWRDDVLATANDLASGFASDPDRTMGEATAQAILNALLGDTATVEGVRGFVAYGRQSVELTGLIPDGDGGLHKSVVWLMPDTANLIAVVIRAYSDQGLLGPEATRFNQDFSLQAASAAAPVSAQ